MDTNQKTKEKGFSILDMVHVAVFAAIIFTTIALPFLRVPVGPQMVHFGNAMVLIGALIYGAKKGAMAASIGLFLFDATHGWLLVAWITVLESVIVCLVVYAIYEKLLNRQDKIQNIILISIFAAITKIILNLLKYTFLKGMITQGLAFKPAFFVALGEITGTFGSAILTIVTVPILYPILREVTKKVSRASR